MMGRIALTTLTVLLALSAGAEELEPKFGDRIDGMLYTDLADEYDRESCQQAIKARIVICGQNVSFPSNLEDREYAGCLPIFREQAERCAAHFRAEAIKCEWSGRVQIDDFDGFGCTVTEAEASQPSDGSDREAIEREGGAEPVPDRVSGALSPKCVGADDVVLGCWNEIANRSGCFIFDPFYVPGETATWSGECSGSVAVGRGIWEWPVDGGGRGEGMLVNGKLHGRWVFQWNSGAVSEIEYSNGAMVGEPRRMDVD